MERAMSLDEFLNHKTNDSSDTTFLRWNKRQPPIVDIWLHTAAKIVGVWRHNWPRVVERTDRDTDEKSLVVWGSNWNCWEPESVLKSQYFRDSETGERRTPPTICPVCLLIERIRRAVLENELDWTTPIFQFDATDSKESRALHAGGIYNAYGRKELTREEIADLKAHRIYRTEAWRENMTAKCSYVLRVVDNDNPGAGIQVSIEGSGLGDKLKAAIKARQKALGVEAGNPQRTPYCIQFEYLPNETRFDNKYNVIPMDRIALTPAVRALIIDEQPPDISHLTKPGNPKKLRAEMESHWCGPDGLIDWDEIFGSVEAAYSEQANEDSSADFPFGANEEKIAKLSNEYVKTTVVINRDDTPDKSDICEIHPGIRH